MNDRIQEIKQRHIKRQHELEEMDMPEMPKAHQDRAYLLSEVERLQRENEAMKEALEFYASYWNHEVQIEDVGKTSMQRDFGEKARTALSHLKG